MQKSANGTWHIQDMLGFSSVITVPHRETYVTAAKKNVVINACVEMCVNE